MFREGQAKQVLDDLFFDFIALAEKMQPKIIIAENVKGMLIGNAKGYTRMIKSEMERIGYNVQVFLLNGATMGLPQARERVFFIAHKTDKKLKLSFNEKPILFKDVSDITDRQSNITKTYYKYWRETEPGAPIGKFASTKKLHNFKVAGTIIASGQTYHPTIPRIINKKETAMIGSFPQDYNYLDLKFRYLIGMSVPPVMMANVAHQVYKQLIEV